MGIGQYMVSPYRLFHRDFSPINTAYCIGTHSFSSLEVNLFAFVYRLFHRDFSAINGAYCIGTHSSSSFIYTLH